MRDFEDADLNVARLLRAPHAASLLGVDTVTLRRWAKAGRLPYRRVGAGYRFAESDLRAFVKESSNRV